MLPKIHKIQIDLNEDLQTIEDCPGRPVISSSGCHTEKISAYVDQHIKPLGQSLPSYIKDSFDFVRKILDIRKVPVNSILITLDVRSLYTNIDNIGGGYT